MKIKKPQGRLPYIIGLVCAALAVFAAVFLPGKLADKRAVFDISFELIHCFYYCNENRQVINRAFLAHVGGSKVDGGQLQIGQVDFRVLQCRGDARTTLTHGVVGETNHDEGGLVGLGGVNFYRDR